MTAPAVLSLVNQTITQPSCFGFENGSVSVNINGGTGDYLYEWNNGASSNEVMGLSAGLYTVEVEDENGFLIAVLRLYIFLNLK